MARSDAKICDQKHRKQTLHHKVLRKDSNDSGKGSSFILSVPFGPRFLRIAILHCCISERGFSVGEGKKKQRFK